MSGTSLARVALAGVALPAFEQVPINADLTTNCKRPRSSDSKLRPRYDRPI
jgi:hypothetical protein